MAEFPAMPLWTDAYLADTTHLTTIEHGTYLLLLMVAWRSPEKTLPDDDRLLARYAKLSPSQWRKMRPVMLEFWQIQNGRWIQKRLIDEANAVKRQRESARKAGKASALKRKGRHSTTVNSGCDLVAAPTPTPTPNIRTPKGVCADKPAPAFTFDDFVESWNEVAQACGLSQIKRKTEPRRRAFNARQRECPDIEDWKAAFRCLQENKWMHGDNKTGWRADPDFFLQAKSFTKLVEGQYGKAD